MGNVECAGGYSKLFAELVERGEDGVWRKWVCCRWQYGSRVIVSGSCTQVHSTRAHLLPMLTLRRVVGAKRERRDEFVRLFP